VQVTVTGGAGFIGSHLVDALVADGHAVRVVDDLSTGRLGNLAPQADLVEGDVTDADVVRKALDGAEVVYHQAAHRAVFRSVEDPLSTDAANVHGTLTVLKVAIDVGVRRVVYASSSSVYGGATERPTPESATLVPRSPYAVSKLAGEHYCRVFAELFGLETVALRYFNVFGPRQRAETRYAAVVPLFADALWRGEPAVVHGDGLQTRDFTYVDDVVRANVAAAAADASVVSGKAYNVAAGSEHTMLDVLAAIARRLGVEPARTHVDPRPGDVRHTCADVRAAARDLGFRARVALEDGLERFVTSGPGA
jgi:UDP-glucose 4-epimerase